MSPLQLTQSLLTELSLSTKITTTKTEIKITQYKWLAKIKMKTENIKANSKL